MFLSALLLAVVVMSESSKNAKRDADNARRRRNYQMNKRRKEEKERQRVNTEEFEKQWSRCLAHREGNSRYRKRMASKKSNEK